MLLLSKIYGVKVHFFAKKVKEKAFFSFHLKCFRLCFRLTREILSVREPILKAVAMPPRLFWAPMQVALINMTVHLALILIMIAVVDLNPLWLLTSLVGFHSILVSYGAREPHLSRMLMAWGKSGPNTSHSIYPNRGIKLAP